MRNILAANTAFIAHATPAASRNCLFRMHVLDDEMDVGVIHERVIDKVLDA